jgi:tRNA(Ile)-lysidine synthase
MSDPLLERVRAFLVGRGLLRPDALVLAAVSGGPDSLCLLHLLARLRADGGPALHVAHLDHGARGAESAAEARAVAALAAAWGLPATVAHSDVPALARASGAGLLAAARRARYAFLAETARACGAAAVAVAHQADDQAETVLLHLVRGAGLAGLRGMREAVPWAEWGAQHVPGTGDGCERAAERTSEPSAFCIPHSALLIRPLLSTARAEVEAYCRAHGLSPADDPSNRSERFARVRARRALRALSAENPRLVAALGRTARLLADDYDYMQARLDEAWPALAQETAAGVLLRRAPFAALHPALQRHAIRRAAAGLGQLELSMEQVEAARELHAAGGGPLDLGGGLTVEATSSHLRLAGAGVGRAQPPGPQLPVAELPLPVPGSVALGAGWSVVARCEPPGPRGDWVALDAAALDGPLVLRRRRPGDRFRPAGGAGSRKLQDFFVDRKVPALLRDAWPILATPAAVVWVAGLRADGRFVAAEQTRGTIWVTLTHEPEP